MHWRNLSEPRALGETPEGYVVALEIDDGQGWEPAMHCARPGGGGICDEVIAAIEAGQFSGSLLPWQPSPAPQADPAPQRLDAITFWDRAAAFGHSEDAAAAIAADALSRGDMARDRYDRIIRRIYRATHYDRSDAGFIELADAAGITEAQRAAIFEGTTE